MLNNGEYLDMTNSMYYPGNGWSLPIVSWLDKDGLATIVRDEAYSAVIEDNRGMVILRLKDFGYGPESR